MQYIATCATRILQSLQCVRAQYCNIYGLARERLPYVDHIRFPIPAPEAVLRQKQMVADIFTKDLPDESFGSHSVMVLGRVQECTSTGRVQD